MFPIDESVGDRCTGSRGIFESSAIENGIGSLRGMYIKSIDTALIINSEFHTDPEVYCLIVSKSPPPMSRNSRGRQSHTPRSYAIEYFGDWIHKSHSPWTALGDPETALGCILFMDVHNPMAFSLKSEDLVEEIDPCVQVKPCRWTTIQLNKHPTAISLEIVITFAKRENILEYFGRRFNTA